MVMVCLLISSSGYGAMHDENGDIYVVGSYGWPYPRDSVLQAAHGTSTPLLPVTKAPPSPVATTIPAPVTIEEKTRTTKEDQVVAALFDQLEGLPEEEQIRLAPYVQATALIVLALYPLILKARATNLFRWAHYWPYPNTHASPAALYLETYTRPGFDVEFLGHLYTPFGFIRLSERSAEEKKGLYKYYFQAMYSTVFLQAMKERWILRDVSELSISCDRHGNGPDPFSNDWNFSQNHYYFIEEMDGQPLF